VRWRCGCSREGSATGIIESRVRSRIWILRCQHLEYPPTHPLSVELARAEGSRPAAPSGSIEHSSDTYDEPARSRLRSLYSRIAAYYDLVRHLARSRSSGGLDESAGDGSGRKSDKACHEHPSLVSYGKELDRDVGLDLNRPGFHDCSGYWVTASSAASA
jgi:hypothetical protein